MEEKQDRPLPYHQVLITQLVPAVYAQIKRMPRVESYALADQLRRAVVSVPANIAEGQARTHRKEFLQHLGIAKGSLAEVHTLLIVAERLGYVSTEELKRMEQQLSEVRRPLTGLMQSLAQ